MKLINKISKVFAVVTVALLSFSCESDKENVIEKYPIARKITTDTFFLGTSPVITEEQICYIKRNLDLFIQTL